MQPEPLSVLIVDDSAIFRKVLRGLIDSYDRFNVVGAARNGQEALELVEERSPEALILDVEMPIMDGLETLKKLRPRFSDTEVLMFSSLTQDGAETTFQALELGAFDFVGKPRANSIDEGLNQIRSDLIPKLTFLHTRKTLRNISSDSFRRNRSPKSSPGTSPVRSPARPREILRPKSRIIFNREVVALGVSTGGPKALGRMIPELPADLGSGLLIVQHMPPVFTRTLAQRLNDRSAIEVREASAGDEVLPGLALIAPGGRHMTVTRKAGNNGSYRIALNDGPMENNCRPSVDVLLRSVIQAYGPHTVGVIMTGMGSDGTRELCRLKEHGGYIIAQDEKTCTVFGMPKMIVEKGLADLVLPLDEIAPAVQQAVSMRTSERKR